MSDFSLLTEEQYEKMEIFNKRTSLAEMTDFAILTGGRNLNRIGRYWLKSENIDGSRKKACDWHNGKFTNQDTFMREVGGRPILPIFSSYNLPSNSGNYTQASDRIVEVEYGYYPQNAAPTKIQRKLEELHQNGALIKTNNTYTVDSVSSDEYNSSFTPVAYEEYEYKGKKYIRAKVNYCDGPYNQYDIRTLSNGECYENGDSVWIEVLPVKWLVDEKARLMITEKIIFAGVQYDMAMHQYGFDSSNIKKFIDQYFSNDLVQEVNVQNIAKSIPRSTSQDISRTTSAKTSQNTKRSTPVSIPQNIPRGTPASTPQNIPRNISTNTPQNIGQSNKVNITDNKQEISIGRLTMSGNIQKKNPYNLDFSEISEEDIIKGAIKSNVAVFLHGKPGCGKSDRVKQLDPDFIELNLSHLDPELLDGLAGEKDGKAVHIKPPWLEELEAKCQEEPDKIHILFLEELTNASPMMQSKAYGIALDKKVAGRWKLPENARVVAAGNELEDSLVANEIAEPLFDRFAHVYIETNAESWLEWAITPESHYEGVEYTKEHKERPKIHPAIYAYIGYHGDDVLRTQYDVDNPMPHADPRRWKMSSDMLYETNNPNTLRALIGDYLTSDFIAFCQLPTITIEDVIKGNYTTEDITEMDLGRKIATVCGLVSVESKDMPKVREFVKKLGPELCKKFEAQWTHGNEERLEELQEVIMKEQEARKMGRKHSAEEARNTAQQGTSVFKKIFGSYQDYLIDHQKEDQTKDK